ALARVTGDGGTRAADPGGLGKAGHWLRRIGQSERSARLDEGFITRRAARWFNGELPTWTYAPIREAGRAADEIVKMLLERRPPPPGARNSQLSQSPPLR